MFAVTGTADGAAPVGPWGPAGNGALKVLRHAGQWELSAARWEVVERCLTAMRAAVADRDAELLEDAAAQLSLVGPVRIVRIGDPGRFPAPPAVRERLNQLIHLLAGSDEESGFGSGGSAGAVRGGRGGEPRRGAEGRDADDSGSRGADSRGSESRGPESRGADGRDAEDPGSRGAESEAD